jgi:serine/threonine protein kinase
LLTILQDHNHIAFYKEWVDTDAGARIITPLLDAVPLYEFLAPWGRVHDIEMAFLIYKQIAGALASLKDRGVVHNDISESTILVEFQNGQYTSYLTGFSEYSTADPTANEAFRRDLSNLTSTVEKMLPVINGLPCCDPGLRSLMLQTHNGQISVKELCAALDALAPAFERAHFQTSLVSREMSINRIVDDNGTEAVQLLDFLRIILHQSPKYLKQVEFAIKRVIRKEHLFQLGRNHKEETYCSLHDAEKLLHQ